MMQRREFVRVSGVGLLSLAPFARFAAGAQNRLTAVAVIAPSVSTAMKAREIRAQGRWSEVQPKLASHALVVCRSVLMLPLRSRYDCYCELRQDAEGQLNISGSKYHVYLYRIEDDLTVAESDHTSFDAED